MNFGKNIRFHRKLAGLSQTQLANILGISGQRLSNWEKDINKPDAEFIAKLCEALSVKADDLLGLKETVDLDVNQAKLMRVYDQLTKPSKDLVMRTAEDLLNIENNQTTLVMPMIDSGMVSTTQLDYYDTAAGLGPGQVVENVVPRKMNIPTRQVPENADFIIRVVGDSMEPKFSDNDKLFIESTNVLSIGDVGVFTFNGETMVKEFGEGELISYNKAYSPIKVNECLYIQGKVLGKV